MQAEIGRGRRCRASRHSKVLTVGYCVFSGQEPLMDGEVRKPRHNNRDLMVRKAHVR